jgi:hypothetical protein
VRKLGEADLVDSFANVVEAIEAFAMPVFRALSRGEKPILQWRAATGWVAVTPR